VVYFDEVFGYLPPYPANPPTKLPLMTLIKQARAFGVGLLLATQNPVDLDYKALSNIGTWFLGKLQTERDKARVLDGIESIAGGIDRGTLDTMLSSLQGRVFFMHNVHEHEPVVFETRWTLSYLRGPMGRDEIKRASALQGGAIDSQQPSTSQLPTPKQIRNPQLPAQSEVPTSKPPTESEATRPGWELTPRSSWELGVDQGAHKAMRPVLPAGIREFFVDAHDASANAYAPGLYGAACVHYTDARRGIDVVANVYAIAPFSGGPVPVDWNVAERTDLDPDLLKTDAPVNASDATFGPLPSAAANPRSYAAWTRDFEQWLARAQPLRLFSAPSLKLTSKPGESERDFRVRIQQRLRETRDEAAEKLRVKYAPKVARLAERVRKAEEIVGREQQQVEQQKVQTAVSVGATLLGALMGRRAFSASTLGRATTAARSVGRSVKETQDVARAQEKLEQARGEQRELQAAFEAEVAAIAGGQSADVALEPLEIKPKRGAIDVRLVALVWSATPSTPRP
jgi:hypothetical protein